MNGMFKGIIAGSIIGAATAAAAGFVMMPDNREMMVGAMDKGACMMKDAMGKMNQAMHR